MSFKTTAQALTQMYIDIGLSLPTAYEGMDFEPPENSDWARFTILPADNPAVTLGIGGEDEETGLCQIDLYAPVGYGSEKFWDWADQVQNSVIIGKGYTYDTQIVHITEIVRRQIINDGSYQNMVIEMTYISRFTRPTF